MKKSLLQRKGFTLIELIVVIAIIAILTAIVTSNFATSKAKARDAKRISDLAQIQLALSLYFDKCNEYPPALISYSAGPGCSTVPLSDYIAVIPSDPKNISPYLYIYKTNSTAPCPPTGCKSTNYVIKSTLESTPAPTDSLKIVPTNWNIVSPIPTCSGTYDYCVSPN